MQSARCAGATAWYFVLQPLQSSSLDASGLTVKCSAAADKAPAADWLKLADQFYDASMQVPAGQPQIPVIWGTDAVHGHSKFLEGLTGSGWNVERPFQRMRFGGTAIQSGEPPFAVAGPEFG